MTPFWAPINQMRIGPWCVVRRKIPESGEWRYNVGYFRHQNDLEHLILRIGGGTTVRLNPKLDNQFIPCDSLDELEFKRQ